MLGTWCLRLWAFEFISVTSSISILFFSTIIWFFNAGFNCSINIQHWQFQKGFVVQVTEEHTGSNTVAYCFSGDVPPFSLRSWTSPCRDWSAWRRKSGVQPRSGQAKILFNCYSLRLPVGLSISRLVQDWSLLISISSLSTGCIFHKTALLIYEIHWNWWRVDSTTFKDIT